VNYRSELARNLKQRQGRTDTPESAVSTRTGASGHEERNVVSTGVGMEMAGDEKLAARFRMKSSVTSSKRTNKTLFFISGGIGNLDPRHRKL
jgi:hypothetical protein